MEYDPERVEEYFDLSGQSVDSLRGPNSRSRGKPAFLTEQSLTSIPLRTEPYFPD